MDATVYEIILGELGELNCSLVEAFHDTFLENASLSLLSADGEMEFLYFPCLVLWGGFVVLGKGGCSSYCFICFCLIFFCVCVLLLHSFSSQGLYCNATTDEIGTCWPRSSTGRIVERPCPAYINGVKYNTTSKIFLWWQKFHDVHLFGKSCAILYLPNESVWSVLKLVAIIIACIMMCCLWVMIKTEC